MIDKTDPRSIETVAADWAARSMDPAFDDWTGLSDWLADDPHRNHSYDRAVAAIEDGIDALRAAVALAGAPASDAPAMRLRPVPRQRRGPIDDRRLPTRWLVVAGGSAVAAVVAGLLIPSPATWLQAPDRPAMVVEAPVGVVRQVDLADGSRIELAGGSRVTLGGAGSRAATVERGRALFSVRHDDRAPFSVTVGPHELLDAGTVFEVVREPGMMRVSVAEGEVILDPRERPLTLTPGSSVVVRDRPLERRVTRVAPGQIGRWRQTRLSYRDAPLAQVADDLAGALGVPIRSSPALAARRFTGTLVPATLRGQPEAIGDLLDASIRINEDGWELRSR